MTEKKTSISKFVLILKQTVIFLNQIKKSQILFMIKKNTKHVEKELTKHP